MRNQRERPSRLAKLAKGHNAPYWVAKIKTNVARDRRNDAALAGDGWLVLRFWESDVLRDAATIASSVLAIVLRRRAAVAQT